MTTPELIRTRRKALNLTQKALGLRCGYKDTTAEQVVQNWEYGKQPVPLARMRDLAAALGIPVEDLIPGK